MSGKSPRINPLESRKRLLVAESELNRVQLVHEWVAVTAGVHALSDRVKTFGSIASAATLLVAGLASCRRGKSGNAGTKLSWLQTILKSAGLVSTIWLAFRGKSHDGEKN